MAKRIATSDLNHDNWDQEEKPEEAGSFHKANENILQSRIIRQAKRRSTSSPYSSTDSAERKNVFANLSGFKTFSNTPIGSFSFGGTGAAKAIESTNTTEASIAAAPTSVKFGGAAPVNISANAAEAPNESNQGYGLPKKYEKAATDNQKRLRELQYLNMPSDFYVELESLNLAVSDFVAETLDTYECCVLSPIFRDYEEHLASLVEKYGSTKVKYTTAVSNEADKIDIPPIANNEPAMPKTFSFSFGASSSASNFNTGSPTSSTTTAISGKLTDKKSDLETSHKGTSPGFNIFGHSFSSPIVLSRGTSSDEKNKPAPQFSFGSDKPFTFGNVSKPADTSGENENSGKNDSDESPKKEDFTPIVETDAFYSQRCKVFMKKGGSYLDCGVGSLYLKSVSDSSKTQLIVRADNNLGIVVVNTILSKSIPFQRIGTNNVMMVCIPTPETKPPPIPILLRVKTSEDADSLLEKLKEHVN